MVQLTVQTKFMLHTQLFAVWLCQVRCRRAVRLPSSPTVCYISRTCNTRTDVDVTNPQMTGWIRFSIFTVSACSAAASSKSRNHKTLFFFLRQSLIVIARCSFYVSRFAVRVTYRDIRRRRRAGAWGPSRCMSTAGRDKPSSLI